MTSADDVSWQRSMPWRAIDAGRPGQLLADQWAVQFSYTRTVASEANRSEEAIPIPSSSSPSEHDQHIDEPLLDLHGAGPRVESSTPITPALESEGDQQPPERASGLTSTAGSAFGTRGVDTGGSASGLPRRRLPVSPTWPGASPLPERSIVSACDSIA